MINLLRLNLIYLNLLILLFIILKIEILIIIIFLLRIAVHSYRLMLMDLIFFPFDGLRKNYFFEDMQEYKIYQEFEVETSDFDGFFNYENYALNGVVFLPEIYGGQFALNWEDFVLESFRFPFNNLNNLQNIYTDINYTNLNYFKIFNKEYDNTKIIFDYIFLYDYYYYHRKSFENFEFDLKNEKFYYNFYRSIFLDEEYYNLHLNNNEMKHITFNNFIKELKVIIKQNRLKINCSKNKFSKINLENQWENFDKINPLNNKDNIKKK